MRTMPMRTPPEYVVVDGDPSTRSARATAVQDAIDDALSTGAGVVFVPEAFLDYDASSVSFDASVRLVREGSELN